MAQHKCLSCGRSDNDVPLVTLSYTGASLWICPQCLPALIHHPAKLTGKIPGFKVSQGEKNQEAK
jgi:hypothetical protein